VPVKTVAQQAQGMVLKVRDTLIGQRTALSNTLRGLAAEFGVTAAKGLGSIADLLRTIAAHPELPAEAKESFVVLGGQIAALEEQIKLLEKKVAAAHRANPVSPRLATMPGLGPVTSLTVAIEVDPANFESGRHFAAWMGLTPKEHSTGGKQRLGQISRAGNERMRRLFVLGATSVIKAATGQGGKPGSAPAFAGTSLADATAGAQAAQAGRNRARQQNGACGLGHAEPWGSVSRGGGMSRFVASWFRDVTFDRGSGGVHFVTLRLGQGIMPRPSIGETGMTDAERQARYRAARAAGKPAIRRSRPIDRRSLLQQWNDHVAGLAALQQTYAAWLEKLPANHEDSATAEALRAICEFDLSELQAIEPPRGFGRD
jgi:hypothetical protein